MLPHYRMGVPLIVAIREFSDLEEANKQIESNCKEIVAQNAKIANYIKKLESRDVEEPAPAGPAGQSDLPPASERVAEIGRFLRQQRPAEGPKAGPAPSLSPPLFPQVARPHPRRSDSPGMRHVPAL